MDTVVAMVVVVIIFALIIIVAFSRFTRVDTEVNGPFNTGMKLNARNETPSPQQIIDIPSAVSTNKNDQSVVSQTTANNINASECVPEILVQEEFTDEYWKDLATDLIMKARPNDHVILSDKKYNNV